MPTGERIIRFLAANSDKAFTRSEIAAAIDGDTNTVGTNLSRLKERSLALRGMHPLTGPDERVMVRWQVNFSNIFKRLCHNFVRFSDRHA